MHVSKETAERSIAEPDITLQVNGRRMEDPLAVVIQRRLAAGEPSFLDALLALTPEEGWVSLLGKER